MQPLVETGRQQAAGDDDVDRLEPREAREQIEIGLVQPVGIGDPVADGDDDVQDGIGTLTADQAVAQRVFVERARSRDPLLVLAAGGGEKARLLQHPGRAAVQVGVAREEVDEQLLEPIDPLALPPELVVEPDDFGDQPRTHVERRRGAFLPRLPGRRVHHRLALVRRQPPQRVGQARVQAVVQLVARHEVGQDDGGPRRAVLDGGPKLAGGAPRGHEHEPGTAPRQATLDGERGRDVAERVQVRDADEPRATRGNH